MNKTEYRQYLFRKKEEYHRKLARLSFERKLEILSELQKIADGFRKAERQGSLREIQEKGASK